MSRSNTGFRPVVLSLLLLLAFPLAAVAATFYGTDEYDYFSGTSYDDIFWLYAGNDEAYGKDGSDEYYGGAGNDILYEGAYDNGADYFAAHAGNDYTQGSTGTDYHYGGDGDDDLADDCCGDYDRMYGQNGFDECLADSSDYAYCERVY